MDNEQVAEAAPESAPAPDIDSSPTPPEPTPRASIDRAFDAVDKMDAEPDAPEPAKPEAEPEAKAEAKEPEKAVKPETDEPAERERDEQGRFKAKAEADDLETQPDEPEAEPEKKPFSEPPSRFSPDAKAAWKDAPDSVRAEIHRAVSEMESGLQKYQSEMAAFEPLKPYEEMARANNTTIQATLDQYLSLSQTLSSGDPMPAINEILRHAGMSPQDFAERVTGQTPENYDRQQSETIRSLENKIAGLERSLNGVTTTIQDGQQQATQREVEAFAAEHPRFDELSEPIAKLLRTQMATNLSEAYDMAERLNPATTSAASPGPAAPKPDPEAQTRKASKSVTGAPSPGSNPANRKPPSSAKEALDRAFAATGIG